MAVALPAAICDSSSRPQVSFPPLTVPSGDKERKRRRREKRKYKDKSKRKNIERKDRKEDK